MISYEVSLEKFEGPLDLLIHLIQKNKIDIYDIPVAEITNQYLAHIETWQELDMEVASEFIVMASRLLEIKSRMLLPRADEADEEEEDLRDKLIQQLIEYQVFKNISDWIEKCETVECQACYKDPEYIPQIVNDSVEIAITPAELKQAYLRVFSMLDDTIEFDDYTQEITRETYTVEEKIVFIREKFADMKTDRLHFSQLFMKKISRSELVVTFLAILELYKINQIRLFQNRVFQEIIIELR